MDTGWLTKAGTVNTYITYIYTSSCVVFAKKARGVTSHENSVRLSRAPSDL